MYKAVLFDMDGVLTSTSHEHFLGWKYLAHELGYELPDSLEDEVRGIGRLESLELVLKAGGLENDFLADEKVELATKKNKYFQELISSFTRDNVLPGTFEVLDYLKSAEIRLALVSASKNAPTLLDKLEMESYFEVVVDPKSVERGKPAPDLFLKASELLEIEPNECIGIEDAVAGIESIKSAGMMAIGFGNPTRLVEADVNVKDMKELLEWFKRKDSAWQE